MPADMARRRSGACPRLMTVDKQARIAEVLKKAAMRAVRMSALIGFSAQLLLLGPSSAADYPSRPIKLLVGASAGGTTDTMARTIAEPLSSLFGKPFLVENRPGAGGNLAAEAVARSAPDGYTLLVSFTSHTINATLYSKLPFDPVADFTPVAMISTVPSLLVGNPNLADVLATNFGQRPDLFGKFPRQDVFIASRSGSNE
jgi:tripartite-type tricarboxylate transporter receptor subunit TctC